MKLKTILSLLKGLDPDTEINAIIHKKTMEFMDEEALSRHLYGEIKEDKPAEIPTYQHKVGDVVKIDGIGEDWKIMHIHNKVAYLEVVNRVHGARSRSAALLEILHPTI